MPRRCTIALLIVLAVAVLPAIAPIRASPGGAAQYTLTIQAGIPEWPFLLINGTVNPSPMSPTNVSWTMSATELQSIGNGEYGYVTVTEAAASIPVNPSSGSFSTELCAWPTLWYEGSTTVTGSWVGSGGAANASTTFAYFTPVGGSISNDAAGACSSQPNVDDLTLRNAPVYVSADVPCCTYNFTYSNEMSVVESGTAYLVLHNEFGQTVYMNNTSVWADPAFYGSQTVSVRGLLPGTYKANIFVVSSSDYALSNSTTFELTVPTP
jgi:hypothetical protein